jgi:hypothetical protein
MTAMRRMVTYCADSSHCASPVGPIITDPHPIAFLPDDVYIDKVFYQKPGDPHWHIDRYGKPPAAVGRGKDGQARELLPDGTVLPPFVRRTKAQQLAEPFWDRPERWSPICRAKTPAGRRCGQEGGRWKPDDLDEVFSQLNQRDITGVSMRALDLIKHSGIRAI